MERPIAPLKINADELATLTGLKPGELPEGVARVIVTDGPNPVRAQDVHGSTATLSPPAVHEVSPTGSGDVLLACGLEAWCRRRLPLRDAVEFALPYAAANAAHPGVAEFSEPQP